jgi:hypothetical protein
VRDILHGALVLFEVLLAGWLVVTLALITDSARAGRGYLGVVTLVGRPLTRSTRPSDIERAGDTCDVEEAEQLARQ